MSDSVRMEDVAKRAGVSLATVSRVINGGLCSREVKDKVERVINELHYVRIRSSRKDVSLDYVNSLNREIAALKTKVKELEREIARLKKA